MQFSLSLVNLLSSKFVVMGIKPVCFLVIWVLNTFLFVHAQSNNDSADSIKLPANYGGNNQTLVTKNILKIEPLGFLHGSVPFYFERKLSNAFSIEGAVGLTTGYNYLREQGYNFWPVNSYEDSVRYMNTTYRPGRRSERKSSIGYLFILQPRFYFGKQAPAGFFTGLSLEYYRFRSLAQQAKINGTTLEFSGPSIDEDEYERDARINLGYQKLYKKVSLEMLVGVGWMDVKGKRYASAFFPNNQVGGVLERYGRSGFNYHLGLTVGYQFVNTSGKAKPAKKITAHSTTATVFNIKSKKDRERTISLDKNILKVAPFGFLSGVYPILYERKLAEPFSIQVGAGFTGRNYIRSAFLNLGDNGPSVHYTYFPPFTNVYNDDAGSILGMGRRKAALGYMFTVQPRIYFRNKGLNDAFTGISYDFFRYNLTYPKVQGFQQFTGPLQKEHEIIQDVMGNFGFQSLYRKLSLEFTLGLGLRSVKGTKYVVHGSQDGFATYTDDGFHVGLGIKAGYHF